MRGDLECHWRVRPETEKYVQLSMHVSSQKTTSLVQSLHLLQVAGAACQGIEKDTIPLVPLVLSLYLEAAISGQQSHKNSYTWIGGRYWTNPSVVPGKITARAHSCYPGHSWPEGIHLSLDSWSADILGTVLHLHTTKSILRTTAKIASF